MPSFHEALENMRRSIAPKGARREEYDTYLRLAAKRGVQPCSFRDFIKSMDEYDAEWEATNYEYEQGETKGP